MLRLLMVLEVMLTEVDTCSGGGGAFLLGKGSGGVHVWRSLGVSVWVLTFLLQLLLLLYLLLLLLKKMVLLLLVLLVHHHLLLLLSADVAASRGHHRGVVPSYLRHTIFTYRTLSAVGQLSRRRHSRCRATPVGTRVHPPFPPSRRRVLHHIARVLLLVDSRYPVGRRVAGVRGRVAAGGSFEHAAGHGSRGAGVLLGRHRLAIMLDRRRL